MSTSWKFGLLLGMELVSNTLPAQLVMPVTSRPAEVTIYLQGAEITRTSSVSLQSGTYELVYDQLESQINPKSIQAYAPEGLVILGVTQEVNYLKQTNKPPYVVAWEDSVLKLQGRRSEIDNAMAVLTLEQDMIFQNQQLYGSVNGIQVEMLAKAADFFRNRLGEIATRKNKLSAELADINLNVTRINQQINQFNQGKNKPTNQVVVKVLAEKAGTYPLDLSYYVQQAGWTPRYDLRASGSESSIQLKYRADLWQNTGCDWNQVKVTLSTANPNIDNTSPVLPPWYLSFVVYSYDDNIKYKKSDVPSPKPMTVTTDEKDQNPGYGDTYNNTRTLSDYTTVTQSFTNVQFSIGIAMDLPSDGKMHQASVQEHQVPVTYEYYSVPKLDPDAFLVATIRDWGKYNLLPGKIYLFLEGTYVGESWLDTSRPDDSLRFSLGRDNNILVKRTTVTEFTSTKTIGSNTLRTFGYEITSRNNKQMPATLILMDQIPVSSNKDITVDVIETSGADVNPETGLLTWKYSLDPGQSMTRKLSYSVKYPKNQTINGL